MSFPVDVTLGGEICRLTTSLAVPLRRDQSYNATLHPVSQSEFTGQALTPPDFFLTDYDGNGQKIL